MEALNLFQDYLQAWKHRDLDALLRALGPYGSYEDVFTQGSLNEAVLREYLSALWTAFPDLACDISAVHGVDARQVHATCTLTGTFTGAAAALAPNGRAFCVDCMLVFETSAIGLRHVKAYFDSADMMRQLGLALDEATRLIPIRRADPAAAVLGSAARVRPGAPSPRLDSAPAPARIHPMRRAANPPSRQAPEAVAAPKRRRAS